LEPAGYFLRVGLLLAAILLASAPASAQQQPDPAPEPALEGQEDEPGTLRLPFAFYNESFGVAAGYVEGRTSFPQPQADLLGSAMVGSKGSGLVFLIARNLRLDSLDRLFLDPTLSIGYFNENDAFIDGNPNFPDERAGANSSSEDNFVEGKGWDNFARLRMKHLLPIGHGKEQILTSYKIEDGLLASGASGGESLNPFESGRTFAELRPFYRSQQIDSDDLDTDLKTNGADVSLFWDNRDFPDNPSRGNGVRTRLSRDFGLFNSSDSWTTMEGEVDAYVSLGETDWFRQRVLAFDFWTSFSPTWEVQDNGEIDNRPPAYTGATLGGLWRMRGFPAQRFNDKAAIYYSAELRMIPEWNPFDNYPGLQRYIGVEWLQFVPFVEVGRVAPDYDLANLHSSMKWNAGFGVRAWAQGFVVRADTAYSEEGFGVQMMIAQPFQF
jgi:hypothetical protein